MICRSPRPPRLRGRALGVAAGVFVLLGLAACGNQHNTAPAPAGAETGKPLYYRDPMNAAITSPVPAKDSMGMDFIPVTATPAAAQSTVTLSDAVVQQLGVRFATVTSGPLQRQIRASGFVSFDQRSVREVHVRAEGYVEDLAVSVPGDAVHRGQLLFKLYSPRLEIAEQDYINTLQYAGSDTGRLAVSAKRLTDLGVEEDFVKKLHETRAVPHEIPFRADVEGVVIDLMTRKGSYVIPDTALMRVASLDPIWIIAQIPQSEAGGIAVGTTVQVTSVSDPGRTFEGRADYIYPELDAATRTLRVRVTLPNRDGALRANMLVSVLLRADDSAPVLHIPREAVIRGVGADRVIVATAEGRFTPREVQVGRESGEEVEILQGLQAGERVVASGVFLIDSEASLKASLEHMH